ncbi:MAG TPA: nuclear transport factor 2 family protein [Solimonas sp.]|nr:nuclear transport factor 2 family protein [Solimonas sp.]
MSLRHLGFALLAALSLPAFAADEAVPAETPEAMPASPAAAAPEPAATPAPAAPVVPAAAPAVAAVPALVPAPVVSVMQPMPTETVDAFHAALVRGDRAAVLQQLTTDVIIYEQGFVERGRDAYAEGSLPNDATFAGMVKREVLAREAWEDGNVAWVLTRSAITGDFGEPNKLELENTETLLLRRTDLGWKITHIHRSAHPRTAEEADADRDSAGAARGKR